MTREMLEQLDGHIVEVDTHGNDNWAFVAFFVFPDCAQNYANTLNDEPSRARVRPTQPVRLVVANAH